MNPLKKMLGNAYLNFRLKWSGKLKDLYDFAELITEVRNILILIPDDPMQRREANEFAESLYDLFPDSKIRTFNKGQFKSEDLDWFGIPNQSYLNALQIKQYGLVLDLSPEPDNIHAFICAKSASPLRLNLSDSQYDFIYNLHIKTDKSKPYRVQLNTIRTQLSGLTQKQKEVK